VNQNAVQGDCYRAKPDNNDERPNCAAKRRVVLITGHALLLDRALFAVNQPARAWTMR
jgi:hypothetical protein